MSKKKSQKETPVTVPEKVYDFCAKKKLILGVVIAVALVLIAGIIIRGVHLAIEFKGGTLITYTYQGDINTNDVASNVKDIVGSSVIVRKLRLPVFTLGLNDKLDDTTVTVLEENTIHCSVFSFTTGYYSDGTNVHKKLEL